MNIRPHAVLAALLAVAVAAVLVARALGPPRPGPARTADPFAAPADWMVAQRASGDAPIDPRALDRALADAEERRTFTQTDAPALAQAEWVSQGPTRIGGRVTDLAVDPLRADAVYAATASGGVWVSDDGGTDFVPAWPDDATQAVGALAVTPDGTLFAGTGEANPGGGSVTFGGDGLYRSADQGATWQRVGLAEAGAFGRIAVDPADPATVFAAVAGSLYTPGGQRGVYRSSDGGATWQQVLAGPNPTTGAVDLAIDPRDPDRVFAALWDHARSPGRRDYGGVGSGLYRSLDGGDSWTPVTGLPGGSPDLGRLAVAVAPSDPDTVYVSAVGADGRAQGLFASADGGDTWVTLPDTGDVDRAMRSMGWWFGRLYVDPADARHLFVPGIPLLESTDGGRSFRREAAVHVDQHAMAFDPRVPGRVYLGNDGGVYRSDAGGRTGTWSAARDQPWTQLYSVDVAVGDPELLLAGAQDNGCLRSYSAGSGPGPESWSRFAGCGDGLVAAFDPTDARVLYVCRQYGSCRRSIDGGEQTRGLGRTTSDRYNWQTPLVLDPTDPTVLYTAGNRVHRSDDQGDTWTAISDDLSRGRSPDPDYPFGTVTTLAVAPTDSARLYAGTDDGLVWTTADGGGAWERVGDDQLPGTWVTRITVDPADAATAYAAFSGFRSGDQAARVAATTDGGRTWDNRSGDLPAAPVNDVLVAGPFLVAATDVGVYASADARGAGTAASRPTWWRLGTGLPLAPVMDLAYLAPSGTLTAATYGRGAWRVPLPGVADSPAESPAPLETVRVAGPDRYGTAAALALRAARDGAAPVVYVATGEDYADALSAGPAAARAGAPILLVAPDRVPAATAAALDVLAPAEIVVVGGPAAVHEDTAATLTARTGAAVRRVAGPDRYATAAALAGGWTATSGRAYLATGDAFADALAGGAAAAADGAPVLLTDPTTVPAPTLAALERLAPDEVVVLGGPAAVSDTAVEAVRAATGGAAVTRVAGPDRYATAAAVADRFVAPSTVYVASGAAFPDALAAVPVAARTGSPVLLVTPDAVPPPVTAALARLAPRRVVLVGGPAAVGPQAGAAVGAPTGSG